MTSSTPRSPVGPLVQGLVEQLEQRVDGRLPELLLRAEVVVEQRLRHAGPRCDLPRRRTVERPLREEIDRGGDDPVARRLQPRDGRLVPSACVDVFGMTAILIN